MAQGIPDSLESTTPDSPAPDSPLKEVAQAAGETTTPYNRIDFRLPQIGERDYKKGEAFVKMLP